MSLPLMAGSKKKMLPGVNVLNSQNHNTNVTKAVIASVASECVWGLSFMATKVALGHTAPHMLLSLRFMISFFIMLMLVITGIGKIELKGKPVGLFVLMGLCEPVIYFIAETNGIKYTTSSFSGLMISVIPLITVLLSAILLHEHLSVKRFFWILVSVSGVILISLDNSSEGVITLKGVLYLLVAVTSAAFYTILSRSISDKFSAFERTFVMMLMGFIAFTGSALVHEGAGYGAALLSAVQNRYVILPVLFLSVICSVCAFFCLNYSMTYLEVSRAAVFANIVPVVSVTAGVLILGEPFSFVIVIGIVLILTGLYMVNRIG